MGTPGRQEQPNNRDVPHAPDSLAVRHGARRSAAVFGAASLAAWRAQSYRWPARRSIGAAGANNPPHSGFSDDPFAVSSAQIGHIASGSATVLIGGKPAATVSSTGHHAAAPCHGSWARACRRADRRRLKR